MSFDFHLDSLHSPSRISSVPPVTVGFQFVVLLVIRTDVGVSEQWINGWCRSRKRRSESNGTIERTRSGGEASGGGDDEARTIDVERTTQTRTEAIISNEISSQTTGVSECAGDIHEGSLLSDHSRTY